MEHLLEALRKSERVLIRHRGGNGRNCNNGLWCLTLWIEDTALDHWQTFGPGGQARYKDAAIQTTLMVRAAFSLALRQAEGLMASIITLMDLTISAPDHTTISRRAVTLPVIQPASVPHGPLHLLIDSSGLQVYGAGQWLEAKHGVKSRRKWRNLHLAVDADNGMIVAQTLTDQDVDDRLKWDLCSIRLTAELPRSRLTARMMAPPLTQRSRRMAMISK